MADPFDPRFRTDVPTVPGQAPLVISPELAAKLAELRVRAAGGRSRMNGRRKKRPPAQPGDGPRDD